MNLGIVRLYCGSSGKVGFYNIQEVGLAKALSSYGLDIYIFLLETGLTAKKEDIISDHIRIIYLPSHNIFNHGIFNCRELLNYKLDIVQLQSDNQMFAPYVMQFCRKHKIVVYNYVGTLFSDSENKIKRIVMDMISKRNLRYFKKYTTFVKTPAVKNQMEEEGIRDVHIVPVGLDLSVIPKIKESKECLRISLKLPLDKKIIIFVGRLEAYKKPLDAISLMDKLNDEYFLIMIGKGSLQESLFEKIERLKVGSRVLFIDSISNEEIHRYYKAADFFVNFNNKEIFGMSILEAMYQGCIVVAVDAPGPRFVIENGKSGYIVKCVDEMVNSLNNEKLLDTFANARIVNDFTWENSARIIMRNLL